MRIILHISEPVIFLKIVIFCHKHGLLFYCQYYCTNRDVFLQASKYFILILQLWMNKILISTNLSPHRSLDNEDKGNFMAKCAKIQATIERLFAENIGVWWLESFPSQLMPVMTWSVVSHGKLVCELRLATIAIIDGKKKIKIWTFKHYCQCVMIVLPEQHTSAIWTNTKSLTRNTSFQSDIYVLVDYKFQHCWPPH